MSAKKFILALVLSFVVMWLLSGLWHVLLMDDFYRESYPEMRSEILMHFVMLGYFILSVLMVYMYPQGYKGGAPWKEGLRFGLIIGLLWILPESIVLYGVGTAASGSNVIVDAVWHLVEQGIGGIIIGLIHGGSESSS